MITEERMTKAMIAVLGCLLAGSVAAAQTSASKAVTAPQQAATTKTQGDFNLSNRFSVEIDGVLVAGVHSLTDLNALHQQAAAYKDGEDGVSRTRPGNHKPGTLVLTKDWSNTSEWYQWHKAVLDGKTERKSVSVIFHNDAGEEAGRLNFFDCWPSKYTEPALNARNSGHATETIELSYESMEFKTK